MRGSTLEACAAPPNKNDATTQHQRRQKLKKESSLSSNWIGHVPHQHHNRVKVMSSSSGALNGKKAGGGKNAYEEEITPPRPRRSLLRARPAPRCARANTTRVTESTSP